MGGSLGNQLGRWFRLDAKGRRVLVMSGMSAAFAALFGTPIAAAVFAMEVVSVGVMQYSALVPCVFSAFIASKLAIDFGVMPEHFKIMNLPDITYMNLLKVIVLVSVCAGISVLLCMVLHTTGDIFKKYFKNPYLRILVAGCIIVGLTFVFGLDYCGAGMPVIEEAVAHGVAKPEAFILKMLFTALTIGAGYKGGEIVPSFFIGATFGCALGGIIGFDASMGAAIGMIAVFCGVTNSPITSLLIAFELFGFEGAPYFLITISIAYLLSGYYGLYHDQTIVYSKYSTERINVKAVGNINKHSESD
jgi:H+/Cl- antiporter ClcA